MVDVSTLIEKAANGVPSKQVFESLKFERFSDSDNLANYLREKARQFSAFSDSFVHRNRKLEQLEKRIAQGEEVSKEEVMQQVDELTELGLELERKVD